MDCECQKKDQKKWPDKKDETGEDLFKSTDTKDNQFDKIINRRDYDFSSDEEDDFLLDDLLKKPPAKKDDFIEKLRKGEYLLRPHIDPYNVAKEKQIIGKLHELK